MTDTYANDPRADPTRVDTVESPPAELTQRETERAFSVSIVISGIRCTLTYVVLPFVTPLIGLHPGVGPPLGLALGAIAIAANIVSMRRFWRVRHRLRWPVSAIHVAVIVLLLVMVTNDVRELLA